MTSASITPGGKILIVGGGGVGPALAIQLKKAGFEPILFEKLARQHIAENVEVECKLGASLTLVDPFLPFLFLGSLLDYNSCARLKPHGLKVLSMLGVDNPPGVDIEWIRLVSLIQDKVLLEHDALLRHSRSEARSSNGTGLKATSWHDLNTTLHAAVQKAGIEVHWNHTLISFQQDSDKVVAHFDNGKEFEGEILVGCDGLHSAVRTGLVGENKKPEYSGVTCVGLSLTHLNLLSSSLNHVIGIRV